MCGTGNEHVGQLVVVGPGALQSLHVPAVGEHDLVAGHDRHSQLRDAIGGPHHLAVDHRHEPCGDVLAVAGGRAEVPCSRHLVATGDGRAGAVREELAAEGHPIVVVGEHRLEAGVGQECCDRCGGGQVRDADPTERAVEPGHVDPGADHVLEGRLGAAGLRRVEPRHQAGVPHRVDHGGRCGAELLARLGLGQHEVGHRRHHRRPVRRCCGHVSPPFLRGVKRRARTTSTRRRAGPSRRAAPTSRHGGPRGRGGTSGCPSWCSRRGARS